MSIDDDYDYWTEVPREKPSPSAPALTVETIEGVEPLDAQFGVADPLTVPTALQDALFGQPEPTETEITVAGGDPAKVPPLHTYAILDAAKVLGLPEMLEASGLPHRCLFKGDAYDEMKDMAPWIVKLEEGNAFTRNLFTRSDVPWHLWDKEPGIYIRSCRTMDDLWGHFRKFVKVTNSDGRQIYFRFWEAKAMARYSCQHSHVAASHFAGFVAKYNFIYLDLYRHAAVVTKGIGARRLDTSWPLLKEDLSQIRLALFCEDWAEKIVDIIPSLGSISQPDRLNVISNIVSSARTVGFRLQKSIERYTLATLLLGEAPETIEQMARLIASGQHELDKSRKLLKFAQERK